MTLVNIIDDLNDYDIFNINGELRFSKYFNSFKKYFWENNKEIERVYSKKNLNLYEHVKRGVDGVNIYFKDKSTLESLLDYNDLSKELKESNSNSYKLETQLNSLKDVYNNLDTNKINFSEYTDIIERFKGINRWNKRIDYISSLSESVPSEVISDLYVITMSNNYIKRKIRYKDKFKMKLSNLQSDLDEFIPEFKVYNTKEITEYYKNKLDSYIDDYRVLGLKLDYDYRKGYDWDDYFKKLDYIKLTSPEKDYLFSLLGDNKSLGGYYNGIKKKVDYFLNEENDLEKKLKMYKKLKEEDELSEQVERYFLDLLNYENNDYNESYLEKIINKSKSVKNKFKKYLKKSSKNIKNHFRDYLVKDKINRKRKELEKIVKKENNQGFDKESNEKNNSKVNLDYKNENYSNYQGGKKDNLNEDSNELNSDFYTVDKKYRKETPYDSLKSKNLNSNNLNSKINSDFYTVDKRYRKETPYDNLKSKNLNSNNLNSKINSDFYTVDKRYRKETPFQF
ncbi:MAG: hypothetical protein ACOCRX_05205 [Candidatus Woesearchaeota archaeon]